MKLIVFKLLLYSLNILKAKTFVDLWLSACLWYFVNCKTQYRILMQDKIFKVKVFEVTHKSVKTMEIFSIEILRLYGMQNSIIQALLTLIHLINECI